MKLLPVQRREAMYALYAFCREVADIADGEASGSLKETLLLNWRSEIAHLYAGRPRHAVTCGLSEAIHLHGLRCPDFLAIIDGVEMRVAAEFGRALQLTNIFRDLAKMRGDTGSTCLASCCTRMAFLPSPQAGCWRSRRFPMSAAIWLGSPSGIMRLPPRQ
jgi:phytoene/squalene synthetase